MRFVPAKSADQQAIVMLHRTRDLLVRQRTMLANALRGHLAEFGIVGASGLWKLEQLVAMARSTPESQLPSLAQECIDLIVAQLETLAVAAERAIHAWHRQNEASRRLETIPGIGVITASAVAAFVTDIGVFQSARQFAAWLGLTPRLNGTGVRFSWGGSLRQGIAICGGCLSWGRSVWCARHGSIPRRHHGSRPCSPPAWRG